MKLKVLDKNEYATLNAFAEVMIPSGDDPQDDPGAVETEAVKFIDTLLADDKKQMQKMIKDYIKQLNQLSLKKRNKSFSELKLPQKEQIAKGFQEGSFNQFSWLRRLVMIGFYSNFTPAGYKGKVPWETIGYLGPMTWAEMTWSMSNSVYAKEQPEKEAVQL